MALFSFPLDGAPFFGALALVEDLNFWLPTGAIAKFYYLNAQFELHIFAARCCQNCFAELRKWLKNDLHKKKSKQPLKQCFKMAQNTNCEYP